MKTSALVFTLFLGSASAGVKYPEVTLIVKDGDFGSVQSALSPQLKLQGSKGVVDGGFDIDFNDKGDLMKSPKSIWGQSTNSVGAWAIRSRAEVSEGKYDFPSGKRGIYFSMEAEDDDQETFLWGSASACTKGARLLKFGAKKIFPVQKSKYMVQPRFNFEDGSGAEVCLGYEQEVLGQDTRLYLTASREDQNLLMVRNIRSEQNTASVKVGRTGFMAATMERIGGFGKTTITLTPEDVDAALMQGGWLAGINWAKPYRESQPTLRFSRKMSFSIRTPKRSGWKYLGRPVEEFFEEIPADNRT